MDCDYCLKKIEGGTDAVQVVYFMSSTTEISWVKCYRVFNFHEKCYDKVFIFRDLYPNNCGICGLIFSCYNNPFEKVIVRRAIMGAMYVSTRDYRRTFHQKCFDKYFLAEKLRLR